MVWQLWGWLRLDYSVVRWCCPSIASKESKDMKQTHKAKIKEREAKQERQARKVFSGIFLVLLLMSALVILAYSLL